MKSVITYFYHHNIKYFGVRIVDYVEIFVLTSMEFATRAESEACIVTILVKTKISKQIQIFKLWLQCCKGPSIKDIRVFWQNFIPKSPDISAWTSPSSSEISKIPTPPPFQRSPISTQSGIFGVKNEH